MSGDAHGSLATAIARGRVPDVMRAIKHGADARISDARGSTALHVAAEYGTPQNILEILDAVPASQRAQTINARDVWGDTPLHRAAARPSGQACARQLVTAGACVNAAGALGRTARLVAHVHGYAATETLLEVHSGTLDLQAIDEAGHRALLGEIFALAGHSTMRGANLPLRHGIAEVALPYLAMALHTYVRECATGDERERVASVAAALQGGAKNIARPPREIVDDIRAGKLVVLPSGSIAHAMTYVWGRGIGIRCDRGRSPFAVRARRRLLVLRRDAAEMDARTISALQRGPFRGGYARLVATLRMRWGTRSGALQRARARATGHTFAPQPIGVDNCVTASAKMAVFALLCLQDNDAGERHAARLTLYKRLTTYLRYWFLRAYLRLHVSEPQRDPPCFAVVLRCQQKLHARAKHADARWLGDIDDLVASLRG